jgi:hypothetical protein
MKTPEQKARHAEISRRSNQKLREEAIAAYGGKCKCCGETEEAFLVLDHVDDNGADHRRSLGFDGARAGAGVHTYRALRKEGWPPGLQVLCANCNMAKTRGVCPHQHVAEVTSTEVLAP